ncbi:MAG: M15 family metallopeptidase [Haloechinothrix sp.]
MRFRDATVLAASAVLLSAGLAGCGLYDSIDVGQVAAEQATVAPEASSEAWAVPDPGPLKGKLLTADLLVVGERSLPATVHERVNAVDGVRLATPLSVASVPIGERSITVAAVDAASYRRFTHESTAGMDAVWQSVAGGDAIISHQIGRDLSQPLGGVLGLRKESDELALRIGAYATTVPQIDAVVNERRRGQLGMKPENALLVSVRHSDLEGATAAVREVVGKRAAVQPLTKTVPKTGTRQAAYLTGGSVAQAVGSFRYRYFPDGTVEPEASWVAANIRTETVPILGRVTCHRVMLPQLRSALEEIVRRGLAHTIDPGDYGGCYVPRFIGHDPSRGLSLHTWGIAVDLNVAGNLRGTVGEIDRDVVAILKRWGFAWGGDWQWTDPMHFELAALVRR